MAKDERSEALRVIQEFRDQWGDEKWRQESAEGRRKLRQADDERLNIIRKNNRIFDDEWERDHPEERSDG